LNERATRRRRLPPPPRALALPRPRAKTRPQKPKTKNQKPNKKQKKISELATRADVIFLPYQYLLDPRTASTLEGTIRWDKAIVILDEAHNVNVSLFAAAWGAPAARSARPFFARHVRFSLSCSRAPQNSRLRRTNQ